MEIYGGNNYKINRDIKYIKLCKYTKEGVVR